MRVCVCLWYIQTRAWLRCRRLRSNNACLCANVVRGRVNTHGVFSFLLYSIFFGLSIGELVVVGRAVVV
ncbi:hypothetical protein BDZ91DRAFT_395124 [Kalaharituber pfeilii]|nr:hypothetical protein BDZ91DRAFT_395124 [Kalaharituber pfeilii]